METTNLVLQALQLVITGGVLAYAVRVEHRITKLETYLEMVLEKRVDK